VKLTPVVRALLALAVIGVLGYAGYHYYGGRLRRAWAVRAAGVTDGGK
jgi:hypothetical protein